MSIATVVRALVLAGATPEMILAAVEATEREQTDALTRRRESDRLRQQAKRDRSNNVTSRDVTVTVNDDPPRARVRDITPNSENNHNYTLPSASAISDDWPPGKASDHAELICAEMASPWLDPNKSQGLVTTVGLLDRWKRNGASWEHDVLPLIRGRLMNRRKPVSTWGFFDDAIDETIAANRAALRIPEAGQVVPIRPGTGPPMSLTDRIGADNQQSYALAMKMLENGSNR